MYREWERGGAEEKKWIGGRESDEEGGRLEREREREREREPGVCCDGEAETERQREKTGWTCGQTAWVITYYVSI